MMGERRGPRALRAVGTPARQEPAPLPLPSLEYDNLPLRLTKFIGREAQIAELSDLLGNVRMLTLTGAGGCGKSRLALEVAYRAAGSFLHGVCWVDMAPLEAPSLVPDAVATALSVPEGVFATRMQSMERFLRDKNVLIILDNCEHMASSCADLALSLVQTCPEIGLLATSREPLQIDGETVWQVPPLDLPLDPRPQARVAAGFEAVQLFVDRAARQLASFRLTEDNVGAVVEICRRLDGIPLAIELAAARARALAPEQIMEGLRDRFALLVKGNRAGVPHHRTLEASMDWSYELLSDPARRTLQRLSVFAASFSLEAAERVNAPDGIDGAALLDLISELVDKSLVDIEAAGGSSRFRLLETVRQYAGRKLAASGAETSVRNRHLDFFVELSEKAEPDLEGHGYAEWLKRLDPDLDNLRAALEWGAGSGRSDKALRIAASLWGFWSLRGHLRESLDRLAVLLDVPGLQDPLRGKALVAGARIAVWLADLASALSFAKQALEIGRRTGHEHTIGRALTVVAFVEGFASAEKGASLFAEAADVARKNRNPGVLAHALTQLGIYEVVSGELPKARSLLEEALSVTRESGNIFELARTTSYLGWTALYQGCFDEAENLLRECFEIGRVGGDWSWILARAFNGLAASWRGEYGRARELLDQAEALLPEVDSPFAEAMVHMTRGRAELAGGDLVPADEHADQAMGFFGPGGMKSMAAWCVSIRGEAALARGDLAAARRCWDESLALSRETKTAMTQIRSMQGLAALARGAGELHDSLDLLHDALRMIDEAGHTVLIADALEQLAGVLSVGQAFREAARMFGAAQALRNRIGYVRSPVHQDVYEGDVSSVREALGPEEFASAWTQGLEMTIEDAVAYAARGRGRRLRPTAGWAGLTPTELDVVRLVAEGRSNPEIAERLFLARSTVKTHLLHIFAKLSVSSRAELAALAARRAT